MHFAGICLCVEPVFSCPQQSHNSRLFSKDMAWWKLLSCFDRDGWRWDFVFLPGFLGMWSFQTLKGEMAWFSDKMFWREDRHDIVETRWQWFEYTFSVWKTSAWECSESVFKTGLTAPHFPPECCPTPQIWSQTFLSEYCWLSSQNHLYSEYKLHFWMYGFTIRYLSLK